MIEYRDNDEAPAVVRRALRHFSERILTDELAECRAILAGGALRTFITGEPKSDLDLFFPDPASLLKARGIFERLEASVLRDDDMVVKLMLDGDRIDLVRVFYADSPAGVLANFDFTIACAAVDIVYSAEGDPEPRWTSHPHFFADLAAKRLVINALPFPAASLRRLQKYARRGYEACNAGLMDLVTAIRRSTDELDGDRLYVD